MAFTEAYQQKHEMFMALESNSFDKAFSYYPEASKKFDNILTSLKEDATLPAVLLPEHLRCFSAEWAVTKMCYFGVEVFQKWRQYDAAVNQLEKLLEQDVFCFDSRGRWYDRLALNLHQHLKRPEKVQRVATICNKMVETLTLEGISDILLTSIGENKAFPPPSLHAMLCTVQATYRKQEGGGVWLLLFSVVTLFEHNVSTILSRILA